MGLPFWIQRAQAANLTAVSDTLVDSDLSAATDHLIKFTTPTGVTNGQTITVTFATAFGTASVVENDVDITDDGTDLSTAVDCTGTEAAGVAMASDVLTITLCTGDGGAIAATSLVQIKIGTNATAYGTGSAGNRITNPASAGSALVNIAGTQTDRGEMRVAIIDDVVVSATVDTTLTFTITGVGNGLTGANGEGTTTSVTTTATTIPWGTVAPATAKVARQDLAVITNATNGFTVTLWQDQNLLSSTGSDIDIFKDGTNGAPAAWAAPTGTLGTETTYGHEGVTSEDATLSGGDTFSSALYDAIGTSAAPLEVFYHTAAADGTTANIGATKIGFKIEINALQEAATDYTQAITYIATPIF